MNYLEEMFDFVEGSLEGEKEMELFHALSADSELRNKMKNLYTIKNTAKENAAGYQPTAAETMAVFSALSIAPPKTLVPAQPTLADKFGVLVNRYSQGIIGAFIAAALIFGYIAITTDKETPAASAKVPVMSSFDNNSKVTNKAGQITDDLSSNEDKSGNQNSQNNSNGLNTGNGGSNIHRNSNISFHNNNLISQPSISVDNKELKEQTTSQKTELADENLREIFFAESSHNLSISNSLSLSSANAYDKVNISSMNTLPIPSSASLLKVISFELRGLSNFDNISPFNLNNSLDLSNVSFAAFYDLGKGFFVGADIRQESFYIPMSINSNSYGIVSNNTCYDITFRYQSDVLTQINIFPLIQLSTGLSENGYNGRLMVGAKYKLTKNISIVGGFETTGFKHNEYNFVNKNSITYGINFEL
jgi:hypothetical protein